MLFNSDMDAYEYLQAEQNKLNYAVAIQHSAQNEKGDNIRYYYGCVHVHNDRNRHSNISKLQNGQRRIKGDSCPFNAASNRLNNNKWELMINNSIHQNHQTPLSASGYIQNRSLSTQQFQLFNLLASSMVSSKEIFMIMRKSFGSAYNQTLHDISNTRQQITKTKLQDSSPLQHLLIESINNNYKIRIQINDQNEIINMLIMHPLSYRLNKIFPDVIIIDCTYCTNVENYKILEAIGITSEYSSFYRYHGIMQNERTESYEWILSQYNDIMEITPQQQVIVTDKDPAIISLMNQPYSPYLQILCRWHICKNIESQAAQKLGSIESAAPVIEQMQLIMNSNSVEECNDHIDELKQMYDNNESKNLFCYINNTWLQFKHKFCSPFLALIFYLSILSTSRAEGSHSVLKDVIKVSYLSVVYVISATKQIIEQQYNSFIVQFNQSIIFTIQQTKFNNLFAAIKNNVSKHALEQTIAQLNLLQRQLENNDYKNNCTLTRWRTLGLPCIHTLYNLQIQKQQLSLNNFHDQWNLVRIKEQLLSYNQEKYVEVDQLLNLKIDNENFNLDSEKSNNYNSMNIRFTSRALLQFKSNSNQKEIQKDNSNIMIKDLEKKQDQDDNNQNETDQQIKKLNEQTEECQMIKDLEMNLEQNEKDEKQSQKQMRKEIKNTQERNEKNEIKCDQKMILRKKARIEHKITGINGIFKNRKKQRINEIKRSLNNNDIRNYKTNQIKLQILNKKKRKHNKGTKANQRKDILKLQEMQRKSRKKENRKFDKQRKKN